jgi:hypothetical protein
MRKSKKCESVRKEREGRRSLKQTERRRERERRRMVESKIGIDREGRSFLVRAAICELIKGRVDLSILGSEILGKVWSIWNSWAKKEKKVERERGGDIGLA